MGINFYINSTIDLLVNVLVIYYRVKTKVNADFQRETEEEIEKDTANISTMEFPAYKLVNTNERKSILTRDNSVLATSDTKD